MRDVDSDIDLFKSKQIIHFTIFYQKKTEIFSNDELVFQHPLLQFAP